MVLNKKELYLKAKKLKATSGKCGAISSMSTPELQKYLKIKIKKEPKTLKIKIKKKPKTLKIKIKKELKPKIIKIKFKKEPEELDELRVLHEEGLKDPIFEFEYEKYKPVSHMIFADKISNLLVQRELISNPLKYDWTKSKIKKSKKIISKIQKDIKKDLYISRYKIARREYTGVLRYSVFPIFNSRRSRTVWYGKEEEKFHKLRKSRKSGTGYDALGIITDWDKDGEPTKAEILAKAKSIGFTGKITIKKVGESRVGPEVLANIGTAFQKKGVGPNAGQG
jgi:hypothetical protein